MRVGSVVALLAMGLMPAACARVDSARGFGEVGAMVEGASGAEPAWRRDAEADAAAERALARLLVEPLTPDAAVRVAMLASPRVQMELERLGVAQADLVEAGTPSNPVLAANVRWPDSGSGTNAEMELLADVFDLLLLPHRRRIAAAEVERVKLDVADAVLEHAAEVREAYWALAAAERTLALRRAVAEASDASAELSERMYAAGNLAELELTLRRADRELTALAARQQESEARAVRLRLERLMGLAAMHATWTLADSIPMPGPVAEPVDELLVTARTHRLDRRAAVAELESLSLAWGFERRWGWLGEIKAGASAERELDGAWVIGPAFELELPVFDQGQVERARLGSQVRAAARRIESVDGHIRAQVAGAMDRLELARHVADRYRTAVIPLHERVFALSKQRYNFMLAGVFDTIEARRAEFETYERYIEAVRDYWIAHAELERAVGARVAVESPPTGIDVGPRPGSPAAPGAHEGHGRHRPSPAIDRPSNHEEHHHHE